MALHLNADDLNIVHWWVDTSYGVHDDIKGHQCTTLSTVRVCVTRMSKKQKINTTSSTQGKIVGAYDASPQMMWTRYFLSNQGFDTDKLILYQGNKSAILLEENGRESSSSRTKHINTRYFYIKDHINSGEVAVEHCPTDDMLSDYFTKTVQRAKFHVFRSHIMGIPEKVSGPRPSPHASTEGVRVEKATEIESDLETNDTNSPRIRSAGVCWDSVNPYKILSSC